MLGAASRSGYFRPWVLCMFFWAQLLSQSPRVLCCCCALMERFGGDKLVVLRLSRLTWTEACPALQPDKQYPIEHACLREGCLVILAAETSSSSAVRVQMGLRELQGCLPCVCQSALAAAHLLHVGVIEDP